MVKDLNPTTDPGCSTCRSTAPPNADAANVGDGGTTGEQTLDTGTHTVGETAGTSTTWPTTRSRSAASTPRTQRGGSSTTGRQRGPLNVSVTTGSDVVCTITNTRKTGKLEVVKDLSPTNDPGLFNLQIDGVAPTRRATSATAARPASRPSTPATTPSVRRP